MAWWSVTIEIDSGDGDFDSLPEWEQERIADMIKQGYTSGELDDYEKCAVCKDAYHEDQMNEDGVCIHCADEQQE